MAIATVVLESIPLKNLIAHVVQIDDPDNAPGDDGHDRAVLIQLREWLEAELIDSEAVTDAVDSVTRQLLDLTLDDMLHQLTDWSRLGMLLAVVPYNRKGCVVLIISIKNPPRTLT